VTGREAAADRGKAWNQQNPGPVAEPLRRIVCDSARTEYDALDKQQLSAYKASNRAETDRIIKRRRELGALMNKRGC
jgi:hypothetical protein